MGDGLDDGLNDVVQGRVLDQVLVFGLGDRLDLQRVAALTADRHDPRHLHDGVEVLADELQGGGRLVLRHDEDATPDLDLVAGVRHVEGAEVAVDQPHLLPLDQNAGEELVGAQALVHAEPALRLQRHRSPDRGATVAHALLLALVRPDARLGLLEDGQLQLALGLDHAFVDLASPLVLPDAVRHRLVDQFAALAAHHLLDGHNHLLLKN